MSSSLGDFVAAYFFLGETIVACVIISISAYYRPGTMRLFCLANNILTIAQASCTVAYCYVLVDLRVICLLFFVCRIGWVTMTSFTLLILGKRIQKNRSPMTRAMVICVLEPTLVKYFNCCSSLLNHHHDLMSSINLDLVCYRRCCMYSVICYPSTWVSTFLVSIDSSFSRVQNLVH